ncbi:MAG: hypothetical protein ACR2G2_11580 [Pseudonocardia sp.]
MDVIERRALATDQALRRRAEELAAHRRELAERPRRLGTELAQARLGASTALTAGLRQLSEDARARLAHPDRGYPELLAVAVVELGERYLCRAEELTTAAAGRALAGLDTTPPALAATDWVPRPDWASRPDWVARPDWASRPDWVPPLISPPPDRGRWPADEQVLAVAGLSAGAGLVRLAWIGGPPAPVTAGLAVSAAMAVAWWVTRTRRVAAERARLTQWTSEVLAELRTSLEVAFAERLLELEPRVRAALAELSARLDQQVAAHDRGVRAALARRREVAR